MQPARSRTCPKWGESAKQDVEDDPRTPNVRLGSVVPSQDLRGHVEGTPDDVVEPLACGRREIGSHDCLISINREGAFIEMNYDGSTGLEEYGEAEVDRLERGGLRRVHEQEVLRLQISMRHSMAMAVLKQTPLRSATESLSAGTTRR